jgi:hypothetical protein
MPVGVYGIRRVVKRLNLLYIYLYIYLMSI